MISSTAVIAICSVFGAVLIGCIAWDKFHARLSYAAKAVLGGIAIAGGVSSGGVFLILAPQPRLAGAGVMFFIALLFLIGGIAVGWQHAKPRDDTSAE